MMRLNGITKSFVANHVAETNARAVTIRAFQEEDRFFKKNLMLELLWHFTEQFPSIFNSISMRSSKLYSICRAMF
ncbi:hypothetical protein Ahy_B01g056777 [Arachis hypogaea]|uniref:Uncharacterized protein n=1 Tax=Arachis hypogaea TaxID=3818 RepID=A0A445AZK3_ARAHY|nr:hypothetical protein Ahy_B01g056777 [Arachis hypogaea]